MGARMSDLRSPEYWNMLLRRSVTRFFLLAALHRKPMHGYEIARSVKTLCGGCCDPTDAMVYPTLHELTEGGYVVCQTEFEGGRERKVCYLTERGEQAYQTAAASWSAVLPHLQEAVAVATEICCPNKQGVEK